MIDARHSLTDVTWSAELASLLADCIAAISRLDGRISVTSLREAWTVRASFAGFAAALRAQNVELEEIDVFCSHFGLKSERKVDSRDFDFVEQLPAWQASFGSVTKRHWNESLPFLFDPPPNWDSAPQVVRALEVISVWSRIDPMIDCWLALPDMLRWMKITTNPLPCLAGGDPALRCLPVNREANLRRSLKRLKLAAEEGEAMLTDLEKLRRAMLLAISKEMRPQSLKALAIMLLEQPVMTPKRAAQCLSMSLSGAGKLLTKAHRLGLVVPLCGVATWKSYISRDTALRFGLVKAQQGRPPGYRKPFQNDDVLVFDLNAELASIDELLKKYEIQPITNQG